MKILALSGSLRGASSNTALLRAVVRLSPPTIHLSLYEGMRQLPLFNPDMEEAPPLEVMDFRSRVAKCDAIIIASPEYAHGVTGSIKNALDWLVGSEVFACKPVAVLNASGRAHHADESLREILRTMAAQIIESASVTIPVAGTGLDGAGIASRPQIASEIVRCLIAIRAHCAASAQSAAGCLVDGVGPASWTAGRMKSARCHPLK